MEKLVLIDGNSLLNRAFYATPLFTTKIGMPTNAIFGFVKLMLKIMGDLKPEYFIVTFDLKAPTFRHKMYDGYKATRKGMPEELAVQVAPLKELLHKMKIATCELEGYEADDLIGTLSHQFNVKSYIFTGDRDSFQLVDEKTTVCFTKKGVSDLQTLTPDNFTDEVHLARPCQIIDLKALMGDKSDNIPGVPGVGEKTAYDLLNRFDTLDGIYAHIDELKGALRDKLINNQQLAQLSYNLATIDRNVSLDVVLEKCKTPLLYSQDVKKSFIEFEFKSLINLNIFEEETTVLDTVKYPKIVECNNKENIIAWIGKQAELFVYFEAGLHVYAQDQYYFVSVTQDLLMQGISYEDYLDILGKIFSHKKIITFRYKDLLHVLDNEGIVPTCSFDDISLMQYLCSNTGNDMSYNETAQYYGYNIKYPAYVLSQLYPIFKSEIQNNHIEKLYEEIEKPLLLVLFDMEKTGVHVCMKELNEQSVQLKNKIDTLTAEIFNVVGHSFNINSPKQLGEVLFDEMGLKAGKKSKTGNYSTSAEVLEKLAEDNNIVALILQFRQAQKLYSTYIEGLRPLIKRDNTVHTTYTQTITATGRLSSINPNLQNIPIRDDDGKSLRKIFIPQEGNILIDADYSQIELRLMAHYSKCQKLIDAFNRNEDIHATTASQVFNVEINEVTPLMRRQAKAVNFGIIYGISEFGLSKNINIPVKQAKEFIDRYFETYPEIKEYMNQNVAFAKENGYVATLTGRRRAIPELNSSNYNLRQFGERAAMNMPLQGSSADIIKIAMINVFNSLKKHGLKTKLILQVHDELVLDVPMDEVSIAKEILVKEMEGAIHLNVPLLVDVHQGENWYDAK